MVCGYTLDRHIIATDNGQGKHMSVLVVALNHVLDSSLDYMPI